MKEYNSISDFMLNNKLSLDAESNDGADVIFPIKAIEIYGTVLFADLSTLQNYLISFHQLVRSYLLIDLLIGGNDPYHFPSFRYGGFKYGTKRKGPK